MAVEQVLKVNSISEIHNGLETFKETAALIAGGTDLCVKLREGHVKETVLIDISDVEALKLIEETADGYWIGAAASFTQVIEHPGLRIKYPGLWKACQSVGAPQIRNAGTIGGNLANGSPAADSAPPLLALNAKVKLSSKQGERWVDLSDFYLDKGKTVLEKNEVMEGILIPKINQPYTIGFEKLGLRNALAISRLSVSVYMVLDELQLIREIRIASGSLGLSPMRESLMEAFLIGKPLNEPTISLGADAFGNIVEKRLAGRSTCPFKKEAIKGIFRAAMQGGSYEA